MTAAVLIYIFEGLICALIGMPSASVGTCNTMSLLLLVINSLILAGVLSKRYKEYGQKIVQAMLLSLLFKVFLILWDYYGTSIFILPNSHSDSESYHNHAIMYAQYGWKESNYQLLVGIIYKFFGIQRMTAQYLNVVFSFIGIDFLARSLQVLEFDEEVQHKTLKFAAFLPNYLIMASVLIRECLISMIISVSLYCFSKWWKYGKLRDMMLALSFSLFACVFHPGAVAVTIGFAVCLILTKTKKEGGREINIGPQSVILAVVFVGVFMFMFDQFSDTIFRRFGGMTMESIEGYIDDHDFYGSNNTGNSSKYYAGVSGYSGITGILINSPIRMIYFLWVPMPWDFRGIGDIIGFLGSSLFYGGTAFAGIYQVLKRRGKQGDKTRLIAFLIIALCGAFVFAWGTDSAGSALRHREKFYFVYLLLFAALQEYKSIRWSGTSKRSRRSVGVNSI